MWEEECLTYAGLTKVETKVYLTLLDLGASLAGEISRKSGIHRRTVYDLLERLIEKGLVVYIKKNNRRHYQCVHPKRFMELIKEREDGLNAVLPSLIKKFESDAVTGETVFYRGVMGLKAVFEDQIAAGKPIDILLGSPRTSEILRYYFPHYNRERKRKKINVRLLYDEEHRDIISARPKSPLAQIKYLPKGSGSISATNIYGDTVAIIVWIDNPVAIVIKQEHIAHTYRNQFELLWNIAKD